MKKIALFVEGNTELIFIRDFLLKYFEYQNIEIQCRKLQYRDGSFLGVDYDFPNKEANYHFQIIDVGNDVSVVLQIRKNALRMKNLGYHHIIGLRDMYSEEYIKMCDGNRIIREDINEKLRIGNQKSISEADQVIPSTIIFATMEIEAWLLGIPNIFVRIDQILTPDFIQEKLRIDLSKDPETTYFHPETIVSKIFSLIGKNYGKHQSDVESLMGHSTKQDFETLIESNKCNSFKQFVSALSIN